MNYVATLFAVFYAGIVIGVFFGLFRRGRSAPRKQIKQRPMAVDLNTRASNPRVLCEPTVFDPDEDARSYLGRARRSGAI